MEERAKVLTSHFGNNSKLLPEIVKLYVHSGDVVADVTYGRGVFWKNIDTSIYDFRPTDLMDGVDFGNLPYVDFEIDVLVLDPPYMHGGATVKKSLNKCYRNKNTSHASVMRLYAKGIMEATRVLCRGGLIFVKTQDEIESGKQKFTHNELIVLLGLLGFDIIDLFILTQTTVPTMRATYQKTARKNHSYMIVAKLTK